MGLEISAADGGKKFQLVDTYIFSIPQSGFFILASNATIWLTSIRKGPQDQDEGHLIELDHWNHTTSKTETRIEKCARLPVEGEPKNCTKMDRKV
jgi:hypothetical protein